MKLRAQRLIVRNAPVQRKRRPFVGQEDHGARVGLTDLIQQNVTPCAGGVVHDPDNGGLARQVRDIPGRGHKRLAVGSGGGADGFAVNEQVDGALFGHLASPDQEVDELALDPEFRRGERARRVIAAVKGVHESQPLESGNWLLSVQGALGGAASEGGPLRFPRPVGIALEVGDGNIGPRVGGQQRDGTCQRKYK